MTEHEEALLVLGNIADAALRWEEKAFAKEELIATEREWSLLLQTFGIHPNHGEVPGDSLVVYGVTVRRMRG